MDIIDSLFQKDEFITGQQRKFIFCLIRQIYEGAEVKKKDIFGKNLDAYKDTDRYKRLVAIVYLNNKSMNELLLKEGWAWWYEAYAKKEYKYKELQEEAQRRKRGMWRNKGNIPPWEFRNMKRR